MTDYRRGGQGFVQLGPMVSEITGRGAGLIFDRLAGKSRNRARIYAKRPATDKQQAQRAIFKVFDRIWTSFTLPQKMAWNSIGIRRKEIGYWTFMRYNLKFRKPPLPPLTNPNEVPQPDPPV